MDSADLQSLSNRRLDWYKSEELSIPVVFRICMSSNSRIEESLLLPGQNIEGFTVKTLISEGAFGSVFHAVDGLRHVAIKVESKTATVII